MQRVIETVNVSPTFFDAIKKMESVSKQLQEKADAFNRAAANNAAILEELENLETQADLKFREYQVDLNLRIKEDSNKVLAQLCKQLELTAISTSEYFDLEKRHEAELLAVKKEVNADWAVKLAAVENKHKLDNTSLQVELRFANQQIELLQSQLETAKTELTELRTMHERVMESISKKGDTIQIGK